MEELGADAGSFGSQSTWSDSEAEKTMQPQEGQECELEELRAVNKQQEQELRKLRNILAYTECRGSENKVSAGDESVVELKRELMTKDVFVSELERQLIKQQQGIADELSKRKAAQYKQIQSAREICDLLHRCSEYQLEVIRLESENLSMRQLCMPEAESRKPKESVRSISQKPKERPIMDDATPISPRQGRECQSPSNTGQECRSPSNTTSDKDEANNWAYDGGVWRRKAGSFSLEAAKPKAGSMSLPIRQGVKTALPIPKRSYSQA